MDIERCPFCGELLLLTDPRKGVYANSRPWYVLCIECLTEGPISNVSAEDAIMKWNAWKRHAIVDDCECQKAGGS